jgi:hypothetical protein
VLFSDDRVAADINAKFEPVWESVRPVPVVRIDFGNDRVITRTLNGNIATYVCAADGQVLDVLPGLYEPHQYRRSLDQLCLLAAYVDQHGKDRRDVILRDYHRRQFEALSRNETPHVLASTAGISKRKIEKPLLALVSPELAKEMTSATEAEQETSTTGVAGWKTLKQDTVLNESVRRRQVHEMLTRLGPVRPGQIAKPVYKDVLHADLDDPYLGLGKSLFAEYPFTLEDRTE